MIRYAITDRSRFPGSDAEKTAALLQLAEQWARLGIDFVQLREKQMPVGALTELAQKMVHVLGPETKLLVNGRADVAVAAGAAGVHLTAHPDELTPEQVRRVFAIAGAAVPVVSVSCHSVAEVERARDGGADLVLFAPVFEKTVAGEQVSPGAGLDALRHACVAAGTMPVLALGGVTADNAALCMEAGAAGVAGIRLFANTDAQSTATS